MLEYDMSFGLIPHWNKRVNSLDSGKAERQLGRKFYVYQVIDHNPNETVFDEIEDCCNEFATDYWYAYVSGGHLQLGFLNKDDAVTFKMMVTIYVDQEHVVDFRPSVRAKMA